MSKAERLKEEIGWLKVVFAVCVALDASLVAWLALSYAIAKSVLVAASFEICASDKRVPDDPSLEWTKHLIDLAQIAECL